MGQVCGVNSTQGPPHHEVPQDRAPPCQRRRVGSPGEGRGDDGARGAVAALTRTKMRVLESPTLYLPSETLTMGNWEGQEQQPRISRTCRQRGERSVGCGPPAIGPAPMDRCRQRAHRGGEPAWSWPGSSPPPAHACPRGQHRCLYLPGSSWVGSCGSPSQQLPLQPRAVGSTHSTHTLWERGPGGFPRPATLVQAENKHNSLHLLPAPLPGAHLLWDPQVWGAQSHPENGKEKGTHPPALLILSHGGFAPPSTQLWGRDLQCPTAPHSHQQKRLKALYFFLHPPNFNIWHR